MKATNLFLFYLKPYITLAVSKTRLDECGIGGKIEVVSHLHNRRHAHNNNNNKCVGSLSDWNSESCKSESTLKLELNGKILKLWSLKLLVPMIDMLYSKIKWTSISIGYSFCEEGMRITTRETQSSRCNSKTVRVKTNNRLISRFLKKLKVAY